jgi:alkylhydroperoxidase family enzyme
MLDYAVRLTLDPASIGPRDIDELRAVGFDETAVLDICQVTCYYNYVNRLADGLGVELEPFWAGRELTLSPGEFAEARARRSGT